MLMPGNAAGDVGDKFGHKVVRDGLKYSSPPALGVENGQIVYFMSSSCLFHAYLISRQYSFFKCQARNAKSPKNSITQIP